MTLTGVCSVATVVSVCGCGVGEIVCVRGGRKSGGGWCGSVLVVSAYLFICTVVLACWALMM